MRGERERQARAVVERWDRVFEAAAAEPRRQIVVSLLDAPEEGAVPLPESASNPELTTDADDLSVALHHNHLPLLEDMGFVEWETDPFVAYRGPRFEEIATVFDLLQTNAARIPDPLVVGCRGLERKRRGEGGA